MLQTVDKVCFVWKLEDDNVKKIISPAVSGRLFTFQCGLKRSNNFIQRLELTYQKKLITILGSQWKVTFS